MSYVLWQLQEDFQAWWHSWKTWKSSFHLFHHIASNRAIFGSFNCYREYYTSTSCRSESSKYSCLFFSSYVQPCISYQEASTALPKLVSGNMLNWSPKWILRFIQDWNLLLCFIRYSEYSLVHQVSSCQGICSQNLLWSWNLLYLCQRIVFCCQILINCILLCLEYPRFGFS